MFKFLHAADIHLDSPLDGLRNLDGLPADEVRGACRRALEGLVALAIAERVGFVLIAGDVYDGAWKDTNTGLFFGRQMARLHDEGIHVFLIRGNHDAQNKMTRDLLLPPRVHQFRTDRADSVALADFDVVVHGQGFASEKVIDDLSGGYPRADPGAFNIGLLHTSADGRDPEHARYAPCSVDSLRSKGYQYWALGHVHTRAFLSERDPWIAFPGNVQGRHVREPGAKGCLVVTVDDRGDATVRFEPLDVLRWATCRVDATGLPDCDEVLRRFQEEAARLADSADGLPVAARVEIRGRCPAHDDLAADRPGLDANIRAAAQLVGGGRFWVEKVRLATTAEGPDAWDGPGEDAIGVLLETLDALREDSPALVELARDELSDLKRRLAGVDGDGLSDPDWLRSAIDEVRPLLLARLLGPRPGRA